MRPGTAFHRHGSPPCTAAEEWLATAGVDYAVPGQPISRRLLFGTEEIGRRVLCDADRPHIIEDELVVARLGSGVVEPGRGNRNSPTGSTRNTLPCSATRLRFSKTNFLECARAKIVDAQRNDVLYQQLHLIFTEELNFLAR